MKPKMVAKTRERLVAKLDKLVAANGKLDALPEVTDGNNTKLMKSITAAAKKVATQAREIAKIASAFEPSAPEAE